MFLIDLHTHTRYGSSCAYMDPDDLVKRAKTVGLDGVCITEHNQLWSQEALKRLRDKHNFLVLGGVEITTDCGDLLVFGLEGRLIKIYLAEELRQAVDEAGGVIIAAHPLRGYLNSTNPNSKDSPMVETAASLPIFNYVDSVEIYNGMTNYLETELTAQVANHLGLYGTGGSDAHSIMGVGYCLTAFENKINNEKDLIRELKGGCFHGLDWHRLPPEKRWKAPVRRTL